MKPNYNPYSGWRILHLVFSLLFLVFFIWFVAQSIQVKLHAQDTLSDTPPAILERPSVSTNPNATTVSIRFVAYADSILARLAWFEAKYQQQQLLIQQLQSSGGSATAQKVDEIHTMVSQYLKTNSTMTITYSWEHSGVGIQSFHVERSYNNGPFQEIAVIPATERSYTAQKQPMGSYSWRVRAKTTTGTFTDYTSFKTITVNP